MSSARSAPGSAPSDRFAFMVEISDLVNGSLDLDQVLHSIAELVRRVVPYEVFAILLTSERTHELQMRFAVGHMPEVVEHTRISPGKGVVGRAAQSMQPQRVADVGQDPDYISVLDGVRSELAVPILWKNRAIGVMDIQALEADAFAAAHEETLVVVARRIASAIENAKLYRGAVQREKTLSLLNDISREMTSILSVDELLTRVAEMVRRVIDYQLFSVLSLNPAGDKLVHRLSVKSGQNIHIKHDIPMGRGLCGASAQQRRPILVKDVREDPRYIMVNAETRAELVVPLIHQDKVLGVLDLEHPRKGYYTERHARTMTTLAAQMAVALENASLYQHVVRAERQMERDLLVAQRVQRHLLPASVPELPGLEIAAHTVSARQLGGDLYDFLPYKGQRLAIAVGDVSGKGAGAALYGAVVSGILRLQAARQPAPADLLAALNTALIERAVEDQFMTLIYALWHERNRRLVIANSGLPFPIHVTPNGCHAINAAGVPLGMLENTRYQAVAIKLQAGEMAVLVSDGITETMNRHGEEYGRVRLEALLRHHYPDPGAQVAAAVFADVERFAEGLPAGDDRTVVVLKARK